MAKVILVNKDRMVFQATEYHNVVCRARDDCKCMSQAKINALGKRQSDLFPRSFRIPPGGQQELDAEVLRLPAVQAALKSVPPRLQLKEE